jgi:hypothetical protein
MKNLLAKYDKNDLQSIFWETWTKWKY